MSGQLRNVLMPNCGPEYGIPKTHKIDNGAPMNSHVFGQFSEYLGFHQHKITPRYLQTNAICERFMRSIGKTIRGANTQHRCWRQDMYDFLRSYRATPHATTNQSPAELFYGRAVNIKIPTSPVKSKSKISRSKAKIKKRKRKIKSYADKCRTPNHQSYTLEIASL